MRQSPGPMVLKNGCVVASSRPRAKSKPSAAAAVSPKTRWRSSGKSRLQNGGVRPARRVGQPVRQRASAPRPGRRTAGPGRGRARPARTRRAGRRKARSRSRRASASRRFERDDALQPRPEAAEVGVLAGGRPFRWASDVTRAVSSTSGCGSRVSRAYCRRHSRTLTAASDRGSRTRGGVLHVGEQVAEARVGRLARVPGRRGRPAGRRGGRPRRAACRSPRPRPAARARPQQRPLAGQADQFVVGGSARLHRHCRRSLVSVARTAGKCRLEPLAARYFNPAGEALPAAARPDRVWRSRTTVLAARCIVASR